MKRGARACSSAIKPLSVTKHSSSRRVLRWRSESAGSALRRREQSGAAATSTTTLASNACATQHQITRRSRQSIRAAWQWNQAAFAYQSQERAAASLRCPEAKQRRSRAPEAEPLPCRKRSGEGGTGCRCADRSWGSPANPERGASSSQYSLASDGSTRYAELDYCAALLPTARGPCQ